MATDWSLLLHDIVMNDGVVGYQLPILCVVLSSPMFLTVCYRMSSTGSTVMKYVMRGTTNFSWVVLRSWLIFGESDGSACLLISLLGERPLGF